MFLVVAVKLDRIAIRHRPGGVGLEVTRGAGKLILDPAIKSHAGQRFDILGHLIGISGTVLIWPIGGLDQEPGRSLGSWQGGGIAEGRRGTGGGTQGVARACRGADHDALAAFIGTIVDLINYRQIALEYNIKIANEVSGWISRMG